MNENNIIHKIAGVVVLFNPDESVLNNINSYIQHTERLYIIDNSENESRLSQKILKNPTAYLLHSGSNIGIAGALNLAVESAIRDGYNFLLTMDQDSYFDEQVIEKLTAALNAFPDAGIVTPVHANKFNVPERTSSLYEEIPVTKTSGNILNLEVYKSVGPFNEDFFIDYVDIEYCMRITRAGYKVIQANDAILIHNEADLTEKFFLFKKVYPYNHHPVRFYYKTRNRFYLRDKFKKKFPDYFRFEFKLFINNLIKVLLYEDMKWRKLKMTLRGYRDYKQGVKGKIREL